MMEVATPVRDKGQVYDSQFYANQRGQSHSSAGVVVPLVLDLLPVKSVVDVGCGIGTWLSVFQARGIADIIGLDGDYVDRASLMVPADAFRPTDLSRPFQLERKFDLAVTLEVAEHLPLESADSFVDSLVGLAPVILFSAGLPYQGGTDHINEQWPEFWAERFERHGYTVIDCLRRTVWNDQRVQPCYAQNTLLFVKESMLPSYPRLQALAGPHNRAQLSVVHPQIYLSWSDPARQSFRASAKFAMKVGWNALRRRTSALLHGSRG